MEGYRNINMRLYTISCIFFNQKNKKIPVRLKTELIFPTKPRLPFWY